MPPDVVTIVSTGIGVSVIAGVLSGFCYILAHGYSKKRSRKAAWNCVVCGIYLRTRTAQTTKVVICIECEERVCKLRCSKRDFAKRGWICYYCLKKSTWLQDMLHSLTVQFKKLKGSNRLISKKTTKMGENSESLRKEDKECVRDFIEKLVSTMLGGSVDDASIYRIYNDRQYKILFDRYHEDLSNAITNLSSTLQLTINNSSFSEQTPSTAHVTLKHLIQKILNDALGLPNFRQAVDTTDDGSVQNQRTYEELLATAILNKIINKQQNELPSSSEPNKEFFFGNETIEDKWKNAEQESASTSSLEEFIHSDSSLGSTKYVDRVSLTIQQQIDYDDFESEPPRGHSSLLGEESNWYLQKRQFRSSNSPIPVPMLVPNPLTSAKVLIGDIEADETSDLSDVASEVDEIDSSKIEDIQIDSKVVIEEDYGSDEETSFDSGVRDDRDDFSDREKFYNSHPKADITVDDENVEDVSLTSFHSNLEKDSEYLEKYASLPKVYTSLPLDLNPSLSPSERDGDVKDDSIEPADEAFEGSYSKKEKEKWKNPVNMPNNPYSKENITKRIRSNNRYGRDYYTRQASIPSGKQKADEVDDFWATQDHEKNESTYRAVPITIKESESEVEDTKISEVTSDSDLSLINYYDVKNSTVYYHSSDNDKDIKVMVNKKEPVVPPPEVYSNIPTPLLEEETTNVSVNHKFEYKNELIAPKEQPRQQPPKTFHSVVDSVISVAPKEPNKPTAAPRALTKKSDNTLIKKIYSNPTVRTFALVNRDHIPNAIDAHINKSSDKPQSPIDFSENETFVRKPPLKKQNNQELYSEYDINEDYVSKLQTRVNDGAYAFSLEFSDSEPVSRERNSPVTDYDFKELNEKQLVANRLGQFSKSFPNLNKKVLIDQNQNEIRQEQVKTNLTETNLDDPTILSHFVSVKDLRKLFESDYRPQHSKDKPVHSLTARSLSKQMKERLRSTDNSD